MAVADQAPIREGRFMTDSAAPDAGRDQSVIVERVPTVVVDDLHVVYRVARGGAGGNAAASLLQVIQHKPRQLVTEVHAIRGLTFTAYRGEAIGVVGRNGSGKSTLLRAIAGLLPPASGAVYTEGQPSLLGVNAALMNTLSGERNVVLGCLAMGMSPAEVSARYDEIVAFADIPDDAIQRQMNTYSSGMAAKLRFAIASAKTHDVLLVDEALATGDAAFRRRSDERIKELRQAAGTVFLVSHSLDVIRKTCERALWIDEGLLLMDGPADEVLDAYGKKYS
jgi:teichoic acid transport system ATP-binding protein